MGSVFQAVSSRYRLLSLGAQWTYIVFVLPSQLVPVMEGRRFNVFLKTCSDTVLTTLTGIGVAAGHVAEFDTTAYPDADFEVHIDTDAWFAATGDPTTFADAYLTGDVQIVDLGSGVDEELLYQSAASLLFGIQAVSGVSEQTPQQFRVDQNRPNPFNPRTSISFEVPRDGHVSLVVYDVRGRLVRTLMDETVSTGQRTVVWDGRDDAGKLVASGVYIYRVAGFDRTITRRMALLR